MFFGIRMLKRQETTCLTDFSPLSSFHSCQWGAPVSHILSPAFPFHLFQRTPTDTILTSDFGFWHHFFLLLSAKHEKSVWTHCRSMNSNKTTYSKPSCAYVWVLFFCFNCLWRTFHHGRQWLLPVFFGMLKESMHVNVVHKHNPYDGGKSREAPWSADTLL